MAGPKSSSKRKHGSSETEDWSSFSLSLFASNQMPGTLCKRNIEKAQKAGAKGVRLKAKPGKQNAARTLRRAYPKTCWPNPYWAKIPMLCTRSHKFIKVWHCFQLPHEWVAEFLHHPKAVEACKPRPTSKIKVALDKVLSCLGWPEAGLIPLGLHGDAVPIQGTIRQQSSDFLTLNLPSARQFSNLRVPFTVLNTKFHAG